MALPAPDMEDCCKKEKCLFGPNAGQVYNTCDPCPASNETFDASTCDCVALIGWLYYEQMVIGACDQIVSGTRELCPGSELTTYGYTYQGAQEEGEEPPFYNWQTSSQWNVGGETTGVITVNQTVTVELNEGVETTSDNTPWDIPTTTAAATGDSSACTEATSSCGARGLDGFTSSGHLLLAVLPYPEDKATYCAGLSEEDCFSKALNDYGPLGSG